MISFGCGTDGMLQRIEQGREVNLREEHTCVLLFTENVNGARHGQAVF